MSKRDEGTMWPKIFELSDWHGKEINDPDLVAEIHSKLAHLTSETEVFLCHFYDYYDKGEQAIY